MKRLYAAAGAVLLLASAGVVAYRLTERGRAGQLRYERGEMEVLVSNPAGAAIQLFRAGDHLAGATELPPLRNPGAWLPQGNYFIRAGSRNRSLFYPVPVLGYGSGPGRNGSFGVTVRAAPAQSPPRLPPGSPEFVFIPGGHALIGDRLNPREQHYVWTSGFFMAPFETTNAEFREFLNDPRGYAKEDNWTVEGRHWRSLNASRTTALLSPRDPEFRRFGQPEHPVVNVAWYEANAYCRWLTSELGGSRWIFSLPTDAEWEKAARGPDNFDYSLSMTISDAEIPLYNWRKNPDVPVTVVTVSQSQSAYSPNRYGLYHMSGNAAEWTQSIFRPYGREMPYADDDRNRDDASGRRTVRGGSWYSATTAPLYTPYRDAFQPDHWNNDLGFRVAARLP